MARKSATAAVATRLVAGLLVLLSSMARGDDINSCNLYLVNYMNSTLSLSLYGGNPISCASETGFSYQLEPPDNGLAAEVFAQCENPSACSVRLGDDSECSFKVGCDNTIIVYPDALGALQYCFNQDGNCYVPPTSASTTNRAERSIRSLLRGVER